MLASLSANFTPFDWSIVVGYLVFTTWLGAKLAGKQSSIRDFFLGGRKLPWYAVSGSIIATEISAVTFVIVPYIVFKTGGNFTYIQLGLFGAILSRFVVAYVLVPAYYKREIYSPYDYMGNQLGGNVRSMTTVLFAVGGMLAQSARVYLTAEILIVVMHDQLQWLSSLIHIGPLACAILLIAVIALIWTLIGGISTVIWTDAILFVVFLLGAAIAFITACDAVPGGLSKVLEIGWNAKASGEWGKFTFFNFSIDPAETYTIWTAIIAITWGSIGAYGTDQLIAQRMFCCKNEKEARWAIISSAASQIVTVTVAFVGVAVFAYYSFPPDAVGAEVAGAAHPDHPGLVGEASTLYTQKGDRIFPIFLMEVIPVGFQGLIVAGIFAAAVSSLTSILAALSQTVMSAFYLPLRTRFLKSRGRPAENVEEGKDSVLVSRLLVAGWCVVLALLALLSKRAAVYYPSILDLALAMASYTAGALLAGFALGFLRLGIDGRGYMYSAPLSVLTVFALIWHDDWANTFCWVGGALLLVFWLTLMFRLPQATFEPGKTLILLAGIGMMLLISYYGWWTDVNADGKVVRKIIAWPWQTPIGSLVAFIWGYLLARPKTDAQDVSGPVSAHQAA
ncbi:MAG: hypothetical protein AB7N71_04345 [Phycisphaerae bacterium]